MNFQFFYHRFLIDVFQDVSQHRYGVGILDLAQAVGTLVFEQGRRIGEAPSYLTDGLVARYAAQSEQSSKSL